jgi:phosphopantetheine adenylyltransferase
MTKIKIMGKINDFISKHYQKIVFFLLIAIFFNTCGNPTKKLDKRVDVLSEKIDSLERVTVTKTDRKMLDVTRQTEIDKEIESLTK